MAAVQQLAELLTREDCQLISLCLEDSQLKEHTSLILEALVDNTSLAKINLRYDQSLCELCLYNYVHLVATRWGTEELSVWLKHYSVTVH